MTDQEKTRGHSGSESGNDTPGVKEGGRPAWFTDAKWVVGILAFFVVAATALVASAAKLTERETAVTLISTITATMFSPKGLDDPGDIETLTAGLKAKPEQTLEPLPGVKLTATEVEGKSPRELRLMIFRQLAEPIYDQGTFSASTADGKTRAGGTSEVGQGPSSEVKEARGEKTTSLSPTADNLGLLVLLSNESHQRLLGIQKNLLMVSGILLVLTILFSVGFGRLASPGWVLLLVSGLPMILIFLTEMSLRTHPPAASSGEPNITTIAASAGAVVAPLVLGTFKSIYQSLALTGAGLIAIATIGGILWNIFRRIREHSGNEAGNDTPAVKEDADPSRNRRKGSV